MKVGKAQSRSYIPLYIQRNVLWYIMELLKQEFEIMSFLSRTDLAFLEAGFGLGRTSGAMMQGAYCGGAVTMLLSRMLTCVTTSEGDSESVLETPLRYIRARTTITR